MNDGQDERKGLVLLFKKLRRDVTGVRVMDSWKGTQEINVK
jgi:hypothetical protein